MVNRELNYVKAEKSPNKKLIVFILMLISFITLISVVAAYYSDSTQHYGNVTSSTLNIEGTYTVTLNGTQTALADITALNPGDVIVVKGTISNIGNQSAWIRETVLFETDDIVLHDYLKVYNTELVQEALPAGNTVTQNLLELTDGNASSAVRVINGVGINAQTESGGSFDYIGSDTYDFALTIYFMHEAPNLTQGKTFNLSVTTQALQFRNNNSSEPTEAAWSVVGTAV